MMRNSVSLWRAEWSEWCIQIRYRQTRTPEELWPAEDEDLDWKPLFGPDPTIAPMLQLRAMIRGIGMAMEKLGLDMTHFPENRFVVQSISNEWHSFREVVTSTCNDLVIAWLTAITTSWFVYDSSRTTLFQAPWLVGSDNEGDRNTRCLCIQRDQDLHKIASTVLLAEPTPDVPLAERLKHLNIGYTVQSALHACNIFNLYTANFDFGDIVNLNATGYMDTLFAQSWMPIYSVERGLRLSVCVRRLCITKIQKTWRRYATRSILKALGHLTLLQTGDANLLCQTSRHLLPRRYEHASNPFVSHHQKVADSAS